MKFLCVLLLCMLCLCRGDVAIMGKGVDWYPSSVTIRVGETVHWGWMGYHNVAQVSSALSSTYTEYVILFSQFFYQLF